MPTGQHGNVYDPAGVDSALADVRAEILRAMDKFPPFNSAHEGYAVIKEELDELWQEIKQQQPARSLADMRVEAIQVAAMATRFVCDLFS